MPHGWQQDSSHCFGQCEEPLVSNREYRILLIIYFFLALLKHFPSVICRVTYYILRLGNL